MLESACKWGVVQNAEISWSAKLNPFEFSCMWEIEEYWLLNADEFSWIAQSYLLIKAINPLTHGGNKKVTHT